MPNNQSYINQPLIDRINKILDEFNLSKTKLSQIVNVQPSNVSEALAGKRPIPKVWVYKIISNFPKIEQDWLWTGEGEMLKPESLSELSEPEPPEYGNGRELTGPEMERMMTRLTYELTTIRANLEAIEMWREQMTKHMGRVLGYLNEIDGLKKAGKWPK